MSRRRRPRAERRLLREAMERHARGIADKEAYLRAQLEPGETEIAMGWQALVTDRRVLFSWPAHTHDRTYDCIAFDEVTCWAIGRRHDERPVVRVAHPAHIRTDRVPAHHVLWMRWGNATAQRPHTETTIECRSDRDPVFRAMVDSLERSPAVQSDPFVVRRPGTGEARTGPRVTTGVFLVQETGTKRARQLTRGRLTTLDDRLHNGRIAWPIRIGSWLIVAIPAWFISPWLSLVAIAAVEIAWVVGLQWSSSRDRRRQASRTE